MLSADLFIGGKYLLTKALNGKFIIKVSIGSLPQELRGGGVCWGREGGRRGKDICAIQLDK